MGLTFCAAMHGAGVSDKDSVKAGWYDPPVPVLSFRLSKHGVYCLGFVGILGVSEFNNVEYQNLMERDQCVLSILMQCISPSPWVVRLSDKVRQHILEIRSTIP